MPPQGLGMVGALPWPAWGAVVGVLSSPKRRPKRAWRATVLELRRTCKALAELVGAGCVGGAGRLYVTRADEAAQLEASATAGLGRALVVDVELPQYLPEELQAVARAVALAVERGHMIQVEAFYKCDPAAARMFEAALIEASRKGHLLDAVLLKGESGWSVDAMAQLSVVGLRNPKRNTIATLVGARTLQRIYLERAKWADMSILSSLREVNLYNCAVEDLSPLADVPQLVVWDCHRIKTLPAMHNDVLEMDWCTSLTDVSGLAGGRVGRLELRCLSGVEDVNAIGAMQPAPRTVILDWMPELQDVSMLAGIRELEVIDCPKLDKAATLAALEGKVGTIRWEGKVVSARAQSGAGGKYCLVS